LVYFQFLTFFRRVKFNIKNHVLDMIKQKKFLLFAIIIGLVGIVVGSITILSLLENLLNP